MSGRLLALEREVLKPGIWFIFRPATVVLSLIFFFSLTNLASAATLTLSGTLYSDEGVTPITSDKTIKAAVGTSTVSTHSTSTDSGAGTYSIIIPDGHSIVAGTPITIFVDGDASTTASITTKASSTADIVNLDLFQNYVIIKNEGGVSTTTTNANLAFYTNSQDSDLKLIVSDNNLTTGYQQNLYLAANTNYAPGGNINVGASFVATSTALTTFSFGNTLTFISTTTGNTITAPQTILDNLADLTFNGVGGAWSINSAATTTNLTIKNGTLNSPTTSLTITGNFINYGTFNDNTGILYMQNLQAEVAGYLAGRDASGDDSGTVSASVNSIVTVGNYLYLGRQGNATACSQTPGSAIGCELMVFDISSSTNPIYVAGRDASGNDVGTGSIQVRNISIFNNNLYVGKSGSVTACSQTPGSATGCELMFFDLKAIQPAGKFRGKLFGSNNLGNLTLNGIVEFIDNASTTNLNILSGTTSASSNLTVTGDLQNKGLFIAPTSTLTIEGNYNQYGTFIHSSGTLIISSSSNQTLSGQFATSWRDASGR
ncbi:MAG: hypothetical protein R3B53_01925 [Candidatus Paceibacterota bacterium]